MADQPQDRRRRQGDRRGARHPLRPLLVHRHPRAAEELLDQRGRARRRLRGRHGLRRLVDHRLQRDRGVGHDRDAGRLDLRGAALAAGGAGRGADVLRRRHARAASPTRAIRATCCGARSSAPRRWASTASTSGPSSSTSTSARTAESGDPEILDEGGYFDLTTLDAGSDVRRETVLALEQLGIHVEYTHHEVGPVAARDRHALRRRAQDGRRLHDLPHHGQGVRHEVRLARDLHAQAAVRRERLRACTPTSRSSRTAATPSSTRTTSTSCPTSARRSSPASSSTRARSTSVFAQWVNSYKRLVPGYEAPVYCAWSRRNRSALVRVPLYHPGKEQATRMELRCPDPACNPYLTFAALLQAGLEGIEKGYELPEPMEKNLYHLSPDDRKRLGIEQLPRRSARRSSSRRSPSWCCARSASTSSTATSRSSARSGRTTACRSRSGSWTATCRSSSGDCQPASASESDESAPSCSSMPSMSKYWQASAIFPSLILST